MRKILILLGLFVLFLTGAAAASTRDQVVSRGTLVCGVSPMLPGFSNTDAKGNWSGLNVDICRAVAAAVLGNASKVRFVPLTGREGYTSLLSGNIDILMSKMPWTFTRDTALGVSFVGISYYDGQGFLVTKKSKIKSVGNLNDASVCVRPGSRDESAMISFFKNNSMGYKEVAVGSMDKAVKAFEAGSCQVITGLQSQLYGIRLQLNRPKDAVVLPMVITTSPMGPIVRQGDDGWFNIVKWTLYAMIDAEDLGITSTNIGSMKASKNPAIQHFLGKDGVKGVGLGLRDDWAYQIVKQVGNYQEVFARDIGSGSALQGQRGLNALWDKGGLFYAPPLR